MSDQPEHGSSERDLAFFGRIGADTSHEMRNVLSVIGEYTGLLDDLIAAAGRRGRLDQEKLKQISSSIARQVSKGTQVMERLSRFSHATDAPTVSFDLTALTDNITALAQRRVSLAGCRLESELPAQAIGLTSDPFRVQHALFLAIEAMAESVGKAELLTVKLATQGDSAVVSVSGRAESGGDDLLASSSSLPALMNDLGGNAQMSCANGILSLVLTFPLH